MTTFAAKPHLRKRLDGSVEVVHRVSDIAAAKAYSSALLPVPTYSPWRVFLESFPGAWQQNVELRNERDLLSFPPVYACVTLIADDISKLRLCTERLMTFEKSPSIWSEITSPKTDVLRRPNTYQTTVQFVNAWMISRLVWGNVYVLKERDLRGVVNGLHILDACRVTPLVAPNGEVFYRLGTDYLAGLDGEGDWIGVPASEIIHDRVSPLWHPLVGVAPLYAAALAGTLGLSIQNNATTFFGNASRPSGILQTPLAIDKAQATTIKEEWQTNYGGDNRGKTAVLGGDIKYTPLGMAAEEAQQTEQFEQSALVVSMAYKVPPYKLGLKSNLTFSNMGQLDQDYYKSCLQSHMVNFESACGVGLALPSDMRVNIDERDLARMDPQSRATIAKERQSAGSLTINEARADEGQRPIDGGNEAYIQQQNYAVSQLAKRPPPDAEPKPAPEPAPAPEPPAPAPVAEDDDEKAIDLDLLAHLFSSGDSSRLLRAVDGR